MKEIEKHNEGTDFFEDGKLVRTEWWDGTISYYKNGHLTGVEYKNTRSIKKSQLEKFKILSTWSNVYNFMEKYTGYEVI